VADQDLGAAVVEGDVAEGGEQLVFDHDHAAVPAGVEADVILVAPRALA
jgi:hypothetical protein